MTKKSSEHKYTDPDLREEIKEDIKQSDKGGRPGQWSARKSQLLAREYERRGGGYTGEKDEGQRNLEKWTEEDWQTQEGETRARSGDETARYLPKEAWEKMSDEEKRETERRKREGSKRGEQYVANTKEARRASRLGAVAPSAGATTVLKAAPPSSTSFARLRPGVHTSESSLTPLGRHPSSVESMAGRFAA
jgi:hypothetical protein